MSGEPIGPGDMLVRVTHGSDGSRPPPGSVWRCERVLSNNSVCVNCGERGDALLIADLPHDPQNTGWCPGGWRPISRRSHFETILLQLKSPAPKRETEDA